MAMPPKPNWLLNWPKMNGENEERRQKRNWNKIEMSIWKFAENMKKYYKTKVINIFYFKFKTTIFYDYGKWNLLAGNKFPFLLYRNFFWEFLMCWIFNDFFEYFNSLFGQIGEFLFGQIGEFLFIFPIS